VGDVEMLPEPTILSVSGTQRLHEEVEELQLEG
jgi:hypothetical protein